MSFSTLKPEVNSCARRGGRGEGSDEPGAAPHVYVPWGSRARHVGRIEPSRAQGRGPRLESLRQPASSFSPFGFQLTPRGEGNRRLRSISDPLRFNFEQLFWKIELGPFPCFPGENADVSLPSSSLLSEIRRPTVPILPFKNRFCGEPHLWIYYRD